MDIDVVVVGSANADLVVEVQRRPGPGETVLGSDTRVLPGGKGANTAVAAGRLGARVALLGAVGADSYGELLLDSLTSAGVDTGMMLRGSRPTGLAYITVTPGGENAIVVSPGANAELSVADVDRAALGSVRVLAASLEVPIPVVAHAMITAAAVGARPVLNLSPVADVPRTMLAIVDTLVVNEHEAAWLSGDADAQPDPRRLLVLGPRAAVITLGARGALLATATKPSIVHEVPAPQVDPVDTTGAGDAFTGALAASLATGAELLDAVHTAVKVAAISVTRPGAQPSYPAANELD